jgi:TolB-like protein/Flp pilus assembly protein TadD
VFRFGPFELDAAAYQLRDSGVPVKIEHRAMQLLICLVEHHGQLIGRNELVDRLWGSDVFVDVEAGINTAVRKVRSALGDSTERPQYLETVTGKGYRFVGAVETATAGTSHTRIAVLPVTILDNTTDSQYLADGITEEVIAALGQVAPEQLRVIGRTTMMRYKDSPLSLSQIALETGARFLVESSLRCEGDAIRLVTRLIGSFDQTQLWCRTFDGERQTSILALQRELSEAIASAVRAQLSPARTETISRRQSVNPIAYDLYLRGRVLWNQLSADTTRRAVELFQRATVFDRDYALPWAGMAISFASAPITGDAPALQMLAMARNAVDQAERGGPDLAETHVAAGFVRFWLEWDFALAESSFRRALEIDCSDSLAHRMLGIVLAYQQRPEEADRAARIACELDPLNAATFALASQVAYFGREFSRALAFARKAVQIDPNMWVGHMQLAQAAERLGEYEDAIRALQSAALFSGNNSKATGLHGFITAVSGREDLAHIRIQELKDRRSQRFVPPYAEALIWLGLGDFEQSVRCLESCIEVHDVHLNFLLVDAKWDAFRDQPRFSALVAQCGFRRPGSALPPHSQPATPPSA